MTILSYFHYLPVPIYRVLLRFLLDGLSNPIILSTKDNLPVKLIKLQVDQIIEGGCIDSLESLERASPQDLNFSLPSPPFLCPKKLPPTGAHLKKNYPP